MNLSGAQTCALLMLQEMKMKIEINITPDDLANIVVDMKLKRPNCKKVLEKILDTVRSDIEINYEELNQLQIISDEASASGENKDNGTKI